MERGQQAAIHAQAASHPGDHPLGAPVDWRVGAAGHASGSVISSTAIRLPRPDTAAQRPTRSPAPQWARHIHPPVMVSTHSSGHPHPGQTARTHTPFGLEPGRGAEDGMKPVFAKPGIKNLPGDGTAVLPAAGARQQPAATARHSPQAAAGTLGAARFAAVGVGTLEPTPDKGPARPLKPAPRLAPCATPQPADPLPSPARRDDQPGRKAANRPSQIAVLKPAPPSHGDRAPRRPHLTGTLQPGASTQPSTEPATATASTKAPKSTPGSGRALRAAAVARFTSVPSARRWPCRRQSHRRHRRHQRNAGGLQRGKGR